MTPARQDDYSIDDGGKNCAVKIYERIFKYPPSLQIYCLGFPYLGQLKEPISAEKVGSARNFSNADFSDASTASGKRGHIKDHVGSFVISQPPLCPTVLPDLSKDDNLDHVELLDASKTQIVEKGP